MSRHTYNPPHDWDFPVSHCDGEDGEWSAITLEAGTTLIVGQVAQCDALVAAVERVRAHLQHRRRYEIHAADRLAPCEPNEYAKGD